jgi:phage protein D
MLVAARPDFAVDGRKAPELGDRLVSLLAAEDDSGMARFEARFVNWGPIQGGGYGFLHDDRKLLDFGKGITVTWGGQTLFDGRVTALEGVFPAEGPPEFAVLAEDRLQDLRMTRRTRSFLDGTDADVFRAVAADHGLSPVLDLDGPTRPAIAQVNQSDLAFLRDRARRLDADVWVDGTTLNAAIRSKRSDPALALVWPGSVRSLAVTADLAAQRTSVVVSAWDPRTKDVASHEATDSVLGSAELNGGTSGSAVLNRAFGDRVETIAHRGPLDSGSARTEAEAAFHQMARRFVVARGVAEPDGRFRPGKPVALSGFGPIFSGTFRLREVRHVFDDTDGQGLRTEFEAERAAIGGK